MTRHRFLSSDFKYADGSNDTSKSDLFMALFLDPGQEWNGDDPPTQSQVENFLNALLTDGRAGILLFENPIGNKTVRIFGNLDVTGDISGGGTGEANTASNVGVGGVGLFYNKDGVDLQFKNINARSSKVTIINDNDNREVDIDIDESQISHLNISDIGVNTHAQIDTHISDNTIHFTEGSISHLNIQDIGTNTHAQIDSHISDSSIHFTEASIDHGSISGLGDDDHTQYLLANGTRALSADWNAGSHKITAQQLESTVTTGMAPLVVASTTAVTNLNADLLDGKHASDFTLDYVFDQGKVVDGANSEANAVQIGEATDKIKIWHDGTYGYLKFDGVRFYIQCATAGTYTYLDSHVVANWNFNCHGQPVFDGCNETYPLKVGGGSDYIGMYHDGSHGYIYTNTGNIRIKDDALEVRNTANGNVVQLTTDGSIEITRTSDEAYIDFKNSEGEDYDARIKCEGQKLTLFAFGDIEFQAGIGNVYHNVALRPYGDAIAWRSDTSQDTYLVVRGNTGKRGVLDLRYENSWNDKHMILHQNGEHGWITNYHGYLHLETTSTNPGYVKIVVNSDWNQYFEFRDDGYAYADVGWATYTKPLPKRKILSEIKMIRNTAEGKLDKFTLPQELRHEIKKIKYHHVCKKCGYDEWIDDVDKLECPKCRTELKSEEYKEETRTAFLATDAISFLIKAIQEIAEKLELLEARIR